MGRGAFTLKDSTCSHALLHFLQAAVWETSLRPQEECCEQQATNMQPLLDLLTGKKTLRAENLTWPACRARNERQTQQAVRKQRGFLTPYGRVLVQNTVSLSNLFSVICFLLLDLSTMCIYLLFYIGKHHLIIIMKTLFFNFIFGIERVYHNVLQFKKKSNVC